MLDKRPSLGAGPASQMAKFARLDMQSQRVEAIAPVVDMVYGFIDSLDAIDTDEVLPAAYDPRWS